MYQAPTRFIQKLDIDSVTDSVTRTIALSRHCRVSAQWSRALQHSEITQAEIDYLQQPNGLKSLPTMVFDCI